MVVGESQSCVQTMTALSPPSHPPRIPAGGMGVCPIPGGRCAGRVRFFPGGWRCEVHAPGAERVRYAQTTNRRTA